MVIGTDAYNFIASDFLVRWWWLVSNRLIYCKAWSCGGAENSGPQQGRESVSPGSADAGNLLAQQAIADVFCVNGAANGAA